VIFFSFAVRNLRRHWIRSTLSIIGIIIGVIAIASLGMMGNSINLLVASVITDIGDTVVITPHTAFGGTFAGDPRAAVDAAIPAREVEMIRRARTRTGQSRCSRERMKWSSVAARVGMPG